MVIAWRGHFRCWDGLSCGGTPKSCPYVRWQRPVIEPSREACGLAPLGSEHDQRYRAAAWTQGI